MIRVTRAGEERRDEEKKVKEVWKKRERGRKKGGEVRTDESLGLFPAVLQTPEVYI